MPRPPSRPLVTILLLATVPAAGAALACTRILWNDNGHAMMVGRTNDSPESAEPALTVLPRGMARDGGLLAGQAVVTDNPARWTSRHGRLVTTVYGIGTVDGLNEAGLGAHLLCLTATDLGVRDPGLPGIQANLDAGAGVRVLDPDDIRLTGNVTGDFAPAPAPF